jgi:large conductance mechanosensitive channel
MPSVAGAKTRAKNFSKGFTEFITHYNVLPLAIGVVIGTAANDLVGKVVNGLITPLISLLQPNSNLATWEVNVNGAIFKIGEVADATISFAIVALVVYIIAKLILRQDPPQK